MSTNLSTRPFIGPSRNTPAAVRPGGPTAVCTIAPSYLLRQVAERGNPQQRAAAVRALALSAGVRARRAALTYVVQDLGLRPKALGLTTGEHLSVYDVGHGGTADLPGTLRRGEDDGPAGDAAVDGAYTGASATYEFYRLVLGRDSVDDDGLELVSSVHFDTDFDNAFWNGVQMVYGDGSGEIFLKGSLTTSLDVMAHELTHGVTQYTAGLAYRGQSGALNESMSDVFGSLVKQYADGQDAATADWLIGAGIVGSAIPGKALRSMSDPGTAYDGDPQPRDMDGYVDLPDDDDPRNDNGGVHVNSGIPNRAFYLVATALGGKAWEGAGKIWYDALTDYLRPHSDFAEAAEVTATAAGKRFGEGSSEHKAVLEAWREVKVT